MFTLKQIEAFYWVATLRGFGRAADQLHTTQSSISKRIDELEYSLGCSLFEESAKRSQLSQRGRELLTECDEMLKCRDRILARFKADSNVDRRVRIGITELTAMTWFSAFMGRARDLWPNLTLDPIVDSSDSLINQLNEDRIDYIIIPNVGKREPANGFYIGTARSSWIYGGGGENGEDTRTLGHLDRFTLITEERSSRIGAYFQEWMDNHNIKFDKIIYCNNLIATAGLILGGGRFISNSLSAEYFAEYVRVGSMKVLHGIHQPPDIEYFSYSKNQTPEFEYINLLARENCNFTTKIV